MESGHEALAGLHSRDNNDVTSPRGASLRDDETFRERIYRRCKEPLNLLIAAGAVSFFDSLDGRYAVIRTWSIDASQPG